MGRFSAILAIEFPTAAVRLYDAIVLGCTPMKRLASYAEIEEFANLVNTTFLDISLYVSWRPITDEAHSAAPRNEAYLERRYVN